MNESTEGNPIWNTEWLPFKVPTVKRENGTFALVSYTASAAAIFIGCCVVIKRAVVSPEIATKTNEIKTVMRPILSAGFATSASLL